MRKPILVPIPKKVEWKSGSYKFRGDIVSIYTDSFFKNDFKNEIRELSDFTGRKVEMSASSDSDIIFMKNSDFEDEEHRIEVSEDKICITAGKPMGVFRALTTLKQIYRQCGEILCVFVYDKPDIKIRQAQFDFRFRKPKLQELKNMVQLLSDMKYNEYILYFESFSFYYSNFPQFYNGERVLMPEEIKELDEFCNERYMKLIPFQASFGHMGNWLRKEELRDLGIPEDGGGNSLNPLDPRSIELVEKIYDCILPCFSSDYVIIGFDEVGELGTGKTKDAAEKAGVENLFLDFLLKVSALAKKKYNKKVIYAADMLYKYPHIWEKMPDDAITMIWGYNAYEKYYDKHSPEVDAQNKAFIINCGTSNWCSFTGRTENALYNIRNAAYIVNSFKNAVGIQVTDWGDAGNPQFQPISFFGFIVGACYGWNSDDTIASEYDDTYSKWEYMMDSNWTNEFVAHTFQYTAIDYLNYVIFNCKNKKLGDLLYRMGNYRYIEGENIGTTTRCYELYMAGNIGADRINFPRVLMKKIGPEYYRSVITYMEGILSELEEAIGEDELTCLAIEEMKCNVKMVILMEEALVFQYYYLNDSICDEHIEKAEKTADEILKMREEFKRLWLIRNYPAGHETAYDMFKKIADDLKTLR